MSYDLVKLEDLYQTGLAAARVHFMNLIEYAASVLPTVIHGDIPKTMEEMGGLFSASTKGCYLTLLRDRDDYFPIQAEFKCTDGQWSLDRFSITLGSFCPDIQTMCLEDVIIISRKIARMKKDHSAMDMLSEIKQTSVVM